MKNKIIPDGSMGLISVSTTNVENQRIVTDIYTWLEDERMRSVNAEQLHAEDMMYIRSAKWFIPDIIQRIICCIFSIYLKFELRIRFP